ncbi:MAG: Two-component transcriptional response regulator, LuxR family, partial [uncultured Corynebacteriales bacterium]
DPGPHRHRRRPPDVPVRPAGRAGRRGRGRGGRRGRGRPGAPGRGQRDRAGRGPHRPGHADDGRGDRHRAAGRPAPADPGPRADHARGRRGTVRCVAGRRPGLPAQGGRSGRDRPGADRGRRRRGGVRRPDGPPHHQLHRQLAPRAVRHRVPRADRPGAAGPRAGRRRLRQPRHRPPARAVGEDRAQPRLDRAGEAGCAQPGGGGGQGQGRRPGAASGDHGRCRM